MKRRQLQINMMRENPKSIETLKFTLSNGFSKFVQCCETCTTTEAQYHLFGEFDLSQAYEIEQLTTTDAVMGKLRLEKASASAKRFSLLFHSVGSLSETGRYFAVTHRDAETKQHVVAILRNGSIACSCGEPAAWGAPDRHVFSVLRNREMAFSPSIHLHPLYLKHSCVNMSMSFNFKGEKDAFQDGAKWDFAVTETKNQWKVQGMGMIPGATISGPSPSKKKKDKAAEKSEQARKGWFEIQDYSKTDPEILDRFLTFVSKERTLRQPASSFTVEGETLQGPSRLKKGNSKRNQMPTDHRKRQRS